ncbi:hypothetical protein Bca4012_064710 [Brassica carinata]
MEEMTPTTKEIMFQYAKWVNGNWDLKEFEKECKTDWDSAVAGVPNIKDGYNPAAWVLDVTTLSMESQMSAHFAQLFTNSSIYRRIQELIKELNAPPPGSKDLYFQTKYSQSSLTQTKACVLKQYWNGNKEQDLSNFFGVMYVAILFLGATNAATVQPAIAIERTVFYREKAAGMYLAIPYAISQVAVEIMYSMIQTGVSHADPLLNDWIQLD